MSERTLTLISGGPGTNKLLIGHELEQEDPRHIEFISMDTLIQSIGSKAISSAFEYDVAAHLHNTPSGHPDPSLTYDLAYEALTKADMSQHILLEGFPNHTTEVDNLYELATVAQRKLTGMIHFTASDQAAIERITSQQANTTDQQAREHIQQFKTTFPPIYNKLYDTMGIYTIDTDGDDSISHYMAASALRELMQQEAYLVRTR